MPCTQHSECQDTEFCNKSGTCETRKKYGFPCGSPAECGDNLACGFGLCLTPCDGKGAHCPKAHTCTVEVVNGIEGSKFCKPDTTIAEHLQSYWYFYAGGCLIGVALVAAIVLIVRKKGSKHLGDS